MAYSGVIDEIPGISVDNFESFKKRAYFLSHAHTDHTTGIKRRNFDFARDLFVNHAYIYMSEITAKIFNSEYGDLESFVKPLKFGERELVSLPETEEEDDRHFYVTLIPAGHCLGSAMILFQTNRKTVLYTGDFRYTPNDVKVIRDLHDSKDRTQPIEIDTMYVDTTFQNLDWEDLPKRSDSVQYLLREIKDWLEKGPEYKVALDTPAKYGYEFVFNEIFEKLKKKVHVTDSQWSLYSQIPTVSSVTNDINAIDIHFCARRPSNSPAIHDKCEIGANTKTFKFLTVRLSAYKWRNHKPEETPVTKSDDNISICFSTHCSRSELVYFVNYFRPKKVVGFPNEYRRNMTPIKTGEKVVLSPIKRRRIKI